MRVEQIRESSVCIAEDLASMLAEAKNGRDFWRIFRKYCEWKGMLCEDVLYQIADIGFSFLIPFFDPSARRTDFSECGKLYTGPAPNIRSRVQYERDAIIFVFLGRTKRPPDGSPTGGIS